MCVLQAARTPLFLTVALLLAGVAVAPAQDLVIKKFTNGQDADTAPGPVVVPGTAVTWTYVVSNQTARDADITSISVTDDQGVTVTCPRATLAPNESMICTANGTAVAGQYANIGTATGTLLQIPVSASDPSHYFGQVAGLLTLVKATNGQDANTPPGPLVAVGDPITWTYTVTNTSADAMTDVTVTDDQGVTVTCPQTTLAPSESMTCTGSGVALPGPYANLGTASALLPNESEVLATDPSHYFGRTLNLDYGDAPPAYPTTLATNGARHLLGSNIYLGACADAELDGQPTAGASGDDAAASAVTSGTCAVAGDDEDGVTFTSPLNAGATASLSVAANETCTLSAWIDFNRDGDWADTGENLFPGGAALVAGANSLSFAVPDSAGTGATAARFRCSTAGPLAVTGPAQDGEVEDYLVDLVRPQLAATKTAALATDLSGDGEIDPGDVLAYTVVVSNSGGGSALAVTFSDTPDANTTLVNGSVTTTAGTVTSGNAAGDAAVAVGIGTLAPASSATIVFRVRVNDNLPDSVIQIANQGQFSGSNLATLVTDDPGTAAPADPTVSAVLRSVLEIPTLGPWGLLALATLLAAAGRHWSRQRSQGRT